MKKKLTVKQISALIILEKTDYFNTMTNKIFAEKMWPLSNMHTKVSNQGNGATSGKAAWLCAGSYLAKLEKLGLVSRGHDGYKYISQEGKSRLKNEQDI